jgi:death on curing protein
MDDWPAGHEPIYLSLDDALEMYAAIIGGTVEEATNQLRSSPGLEGALARPEAYAHYENADLALQAAALAHGIAETQPFIDGNKRLALVALLTFLEINGVIVEAGDPELAGWILSLSTGAPPADLAERIRAAQLQAR